MARPHTPTDYRPTGGNSPQPAVKDGEDSRRPEDVTITGDATEPKGSAETEPGDDWGFSDKKPGMATETKIGFALILLLITALSLVVYRKLDQQGDTDESRYAGPTIEAGAGQDGSETSASAEKQPPAQEEHASAPAQGEPGILPGAASYAPPGQADEWGTAQAATGGRAAQDEFQPANEFAPGAGAPAGDVYTGGQPRQVVDSEFEPGPEDPGEFRPRTTQVAAGAVAGQGSAGGGDPFASEGGGQSAQQPAQSQDSLFADQFEPQQNVAGSQTEPAVSDGGADEFFPAKEVRSEPPQQSPVRQAAGFEQQPAGGVPSDPFSDAAEAPAEPAPTGAMQQMPADEGFFSDEPTPTQKTADTAPAQPAGSPFDPVDDIAAEAAAAGGGQAMARQNPAQETLPVEQFTPVEQPAAVEQFTPVEEFTPVASVSEPAGFAEGATEPVPARPLPGNEFEPAAAPVQPFSQPVQQTVQHTGSESFAPPEGSAATGGVQLIAHEVRSNENYWSISRTHYGTPGYFQALALYNAARIPDPKKMRPGMKVLIPPAGTLHARYPKLCPKDSVHAQAQLPPEQPVFFIGQDGTPRCRVSRSDTLSHISRRHLGRASRWLQVYELNRDQLKSPADLKAGMVLRLPADASRVQMAGNPAGSR